MEAASRGAAAAGRKDFTTAITEYTTAIGQNPRGVPYYIQRSIAFHRQSPSDPSSSLQDAERALVLARERGKRELIGQAQLRRAIALFSLDRFGDSQKCFEWAKAILPKDNTIGIWETKVEGKLTGLEGGDERAVVKVREVPQLTAEEVVEGASAQSNETVNGSAGHGSASEATTARGTALEPQAPSQAQEPGVVQTPLSKIRHDWYQSAQTVTISLMVKGVPNDKAAIDIQPGSIAISFPLPTGSDYDFSLDPLFARIDPSSSSYKILSTKIELTLQKAEPGRKWHSLEGTEAIPSEDSSSGNQDDAVRQAVLHQPTTKASAPAYPTSSKSGPKNWDKLATDLTKKKAKPKDKGKGKAKAEEGDGKDADQDSDAEAKEEEEPYLSDDEGDPVNGFFKKLYKNADPDTRRAMMKSYTESNGTALSTNWGEVKKGPVETSPPEGMLAKKFGE
ncbi:MAG: hypothetical protein LQ340_002577 [Diploschistes diacapsis]|nr:MAG: hypothetical protein LQ340_002577 [Diploschistes diacapsis]